MPNRRTRPTLRLPTSIALLLACAVASVRCECDTISPEDQEPSTSASASLSSSSTSNFDTTDAATVPTTSDGPGPSTATDEPTGALSSSSASTGSDASSSSASTGPDVLCGNGEVDPGEACDAGAANADDAACTASCTVNVCGDGHAHAGVEECDDGGDSPTCDADCTAQACGDTTVNTAAAEECDDGDDTSLDGCESDCKRTAITSVHAGYNHTCILLGEGHLKCWGYNSRGYLGYGHTETIGDDEPASAAGIVDVGGKIAKVALGLSHSCVLLDDGAVRCWGSANGGRLGRGNTGGTTCLDAENKFSCAMSPVCCVGDDEVPGSVEPVDLGMKATDLAVGAQHSCAILENGKVLCWGQGYMGQLGTMEIGTIGDDEVPATAPTVSLGYPADRIYSGAHHLCTVLVSGGVRCWGDENAGQLGLGLGMCNGPVGDNELPDSMPLVQVGGTVLSMALGTESTCAILDGGHVRCWGSGGRLGTGNILPIGCKIGDMPPPDLLLGSNAAEITAGSTHTCVRLNDGTVRCWGLGGDGCLGNGHNEDIGDEPGEMPPAPVELGGVPVMISAGGNHTCALLEGSRVQCWGSNDAGELGYGHTNTIGDEPGDFPLLEQRRAAGPAARVLKIPNHAHIPFFATPADPVRGARHCNRRPCRCHTGLRVRHDQPRGQRTLRRAVNDDLDRKFDRQHRRAARRTHGRPHGGRDRRVVRRRHGLIDRGLDRDQRGHHDDLRYDRRYGPRHPRALRQRPGRARRAV